MADITLNSGVTIQGTPIQDLTQKTSPASTDIVYLQSSGSDFYATVSSLLSAYQGYASIRLGTATAASLSASTWTVQDFTTNGANGEASSITADYANDKLTLNAAGTYAIGFSIPFKYTQATNILTTHQARITVGGSAVNSGGDSKETILPSEGTTERSQVASVYIGDVATADSPLVIPIWGGMPEAYIRDVSLVALTAAASSSVNLWDILVDNETQTETLATVDTYVDGDPTALTTYDLGVSANQAIAENDVLTLNMTESGTGPSWTGLTAFVRYSDVGVADAGHVVYGTLVGLLPNHAVTSVPTDVQLQLYASGQATTFTADVGTTLWAARLA